MIVESSLKLVYVAKNRLPTEKAHGYQISKMCEAFAAAGASVELLHPYRYQRNSRLRAMTIFDYYPVRRSFDVETLPNVDLMPWLRRLPTPVAAPIWLLHSLAWSHYAVRRAERRGATVHFVRSLPLAYWMARRGLPFVLELHGIPAGFQARLLRRVVQAPSLCLAVGITSHITAALRDLGVSEHRLVLLPDGVDLSLFEGLPERAGCRRRLDLPADRPIVGYIGRFTALGMDKGVPALLRAVANLKRRDPRPFVLAVGGPEEAALQYRALAAELGLGPDDFRIVDRVPTADVPRWIASCTIVTIPWDFNPHSAYFTSPLKLFEYMASGVPIVASDLPALRDVLESGVNARLVEPGSVAELTRGLDDLLADPDTADRLARRAREAVEAYTWSARATAILDRLEGGRRCPASPRKERV